MKINTKTNIKTAKMSIKKILFQPFLQHIFMLNNLILIIVLLTSLLLTSSGAIAESAEPYDIEIEFNPEIADTGQPIDYKISIGNTDNNVLNVKELKILLPKNSRVFDKTIKLIKTGEYYTFSDGVKDSFDLFLTFSVPTPGIHSVNTTAALEKSGKKYSFARYQ